MSSTVIYGDVDDLWERLAQETEMDSGTRNAYLQILETISRKIDGLCRRPDGFKAATTDATRDLMGTGLDYIPIPDCVSITTVAVKDSWNDTTYVNWTTPTTPWAGDGDWYPIAGTPGRPLFNRTPYTYLMIDPNGDYNYFTEALALPTVQLTAKFGYAVITPPVIVEATIAEALKLIRRYESGMDSQMANADLGTLMLRARQSGLSRDIRDLLVDSKFVLPLYGGRSGV